MSAMAGKLYTMNGNDWTKRYPRIVEEQLVSESR
jgi:ATP-dependent DNA ligase